MPMHIKRSKSKYSNVVDFFSPFTVELKSAIHQNDAGNDKKPFEGRLHHDMMSILRVVTILLGTDRISGPIDIRLLPHIWY